MIVIEKDDFPEFARFAFNKSIRLFSRWSW